MKIKEFLTTPTMRKVPHIILLFWVVKLLTTALGESTSDFLVHTIDPVVAILLGALGFFIAIFLQIFMKKYVAWVYWLAVTMIAIFGTMAADVVHIVLGVPYLVSTIVFAIILVIVFIIWYKIEGTLSIHSIHMRRRELFYWLTVGTTFALGTAAGDMTAVTLNLGYLNSGILFGILFLLPLLAHYFFDVNEVLTFWFAYIMTRPLGASFADLFGKASNMGGIGFGTGKTSILLAVLIILLVIYLTVSKKDIEET